MALFSENEATNVIVVFSISVILFGFLYLMPYHS